MKRLLQMPRRLKRNDLQMKRRLKRNDLKMKRPLQMLGRLKRNELQMPLPKLLKRKDAKIPRLPRKRQSANNWIRPRQRVGSTPP